ncbi:hypothetical protein RLIN73S_01933 [Rhodanobacter lindaniclasticus]
MLAPQASSLLMHGRRQRGVGGCNYNRADCQDGGGTGMQGDSIGWAWLPRLAMAALLLCLNACKMVDVSQVNRPTW